MLGYPVITSGPLAHRGSFDCLLGDNSDNQVALDAVSIERHIDAKTPPVFVWHTITDDCVPVENTLMLSMPARRPACRSRRICSPKAGMVWRLALRKRRGRGLMASSHASSNGRCWPTRGYGDSSPRARGRNSIGWFYEGHDEQGCKELAMSVAAWDGFLNDQSNWPAASRIGNATGATTARDTLGDKTFVKRKRMSQEERHLQILQAAVKIIATKGFWGMSLQNISDELGITEAALYHYISSRTICSTWCCRNATTPSMPTNTTR
mgnify:CR=1 FL=1